MNKNRPEKSKVLSKSRIRQYGDPLLREVSQEIDQSNLPNAEIDGLISHLAKILDGIKAISEENGNALSAPQVGQLVRVILLRIDGEFLPMINPVIRPNSDRLFEFAEECFSMYDKRGFVMRYEDVMVTFNDKSGATQSRRLQGEYAGLVQHEVDHLDGVLFIDHLANGNVSTIDQVLCDDPARLAQVRDMMAYMCGQVP